ncbi:MAG: GHKL domain-containing protein [Cyanobacteria bacterium M_surface_7_m2_037]|nr:GHKL domain-containing protein [Cyanobacteria bacterium K_DeepCast_0m_m1_088]MBM5795356.1 GHKL domain-containing protein [Cyanobacteria bacterium M_surface_7_m2_037]
MQLRGVFARPKRLANRLAAVSAVQLLLVTGGFSLLSYSLGRRSGLELSEVYRQNASVVDLSIRLSSKLSYPIWINNLNLNWLKADPARERDFEAIAERFWNQMRVFPVDYINIGNADGSFVGLERTAEGDLLLNEDTIRSGRGSMAVYAMRANGRRGALLERIPGMTATHEEAWYVDTAKAGKPSWSSIYAWEDQPEVFSISYNAPLFGPDRTLKGVVGVDMVLSHLSTWLQGVWKERKGIAVIVEPNGDLVACSRPELTLAQKQGTVQRANLRDLRNPLIKQLSVTFAAAKTRSGSPSSPQRIRVAGQAYTLQASPWGQEEGLNWTLLTALAAGPTSAAAERSSVLALLAAAAALAGAVVLISRQIRALLDPLNQLESASRQLGEALAAPSPAPGQGLHFTSGLSGNAGEELIALDGAISELVERYNALTTNLREAQERERFRDAQTLALLKDKLRSSLQAAAVAHEINQPLSVLLLNSQLLLERSQKPGSPELPEAWQAQLQSIRQEADRVVLTIETMRALLRNVQTEHQRLDLREVAQSALLYARSGGPVSRLTVDSEALDREQEPAWIDGDPVQIQIAIVNLLRNAAEAVSDSTVPDPWIRLSLAAEAGQWCLAVDDNGPGLPPALLDNTPLQTTKSTGSGLGLFVVRTTMENHHGALRCGTSARGGASLQLLFPAQPAPDSGLQALPTTGD